MAMEVLLRRSIEGVGQVGEIVKVKNGYARNYLLPQNYAALVSPENLRRIDDDRKAEAIRESELAKERATLAAVLGEVTLHIEARAGEDGHLYGSVGSRQVAAALAAEGFRLNERQLRFEIVRELGEYEVEVVLSKDCVVPVKVWVVQDAQEARDLAESAAQAAEAAEGAEDADEPTVDA